MALRASENIDFSAIIKAAYESAKSDRTKWNEKEALEQLKLPVGPYKDVKMPEKKTVRKSQNPAASTKAETETPLAPKEEPTSPSVSVLPQSKATPSPASGRLSADPARFA